MRAFTLGRRPYRLAVVASLLLTVGCKGNGAQRRDAAPSVAPSPRTTDASIDGSTALPGPDASDADAGIPQLKLVDSPPWPAGEKRVHLKWLVPSGSDHPGEGTGPPDVHLVVGVGRIARPVSLALQDGPVLSQHQNQCARLLRGQSTKGLRDVEDLAAIPMGRQGDHGYAVRRDTPTSVAVLAYSQDDGNCPDERGEARLCPKQSMAIQRVQIPESATFEESIRVVDRAGKEHPFPCGGQ